MQLEVKAESARRAGISLKGVKIAAFGIVGFMAATGGIVGHPAMPLYLSMPCRWTFAARSNWSSSHRWNIIVWGRGSVWNAILGALVIGSLGNGLDLSGAGAADKLMFSGGILLLAVSIDALSRQGRIQSRA